MRHLIYTSIAIGLVSASAACSDDSVTAPAGETVLASVTPTAGATGVDPAEAISVRFSGPLASGMEQYVDLHQGAVDGPVVSLPCAVSADRMMVTCTPAQPLLPRSRYSIHVGGGMMDANGRPTETDEHGIGMGGQPVTREMMGGVHGGQTMDMMGPGWGHQDDDRWGAAFTFETA